MTELDDRRFSQRVAINLKVKCVYQGRSLDGFSTDLSPLGIFIENVNAPPLGSEVFLSFTVRLGDERVNLRVHGSVERIVDKDLAGARYVLPGFGVRFVEFEDSGEETLKAFVALKMLQEKAAMRSAVAASSESVEQSALKTVSTPRIIPAEDHTEASVMSATPASTVDDEDRQITADVPVIAGDTDSPTQMSDGISNRRKQAENTYMLSLNAYRQGDYDEAMRLMRDATRLDPNKSSYFNTLKEMEEAFQSNYVLRTCQNVEDLIDNNLLKKAMIALTQCHDTVPDDPRIIRLMAKTMVLEKKNLEKALSLAKRALSLRSDDSENYYIVGLVYKEMGNFEKARGFFLSALQIANHNEAALELQRMQKAP